MKSTKTLALALTSCGLVLCASANLLPKAGVSAGEPQVAPVIVRGCKKIKSSACTSCAELNVMDNECKSGTDFSDCSSTTHECTNSAQCNAHVGSGTCS